MIHEKEKTKRREGETAPTILMLAMHMIFHVSLQEETKFCHVSPPYPGNVKPPMWCRHGPLALARSRLLPKVRRAENEMVNLGIGSRGVEEDGQ